MTGSVGFISDESNKKLHRSITTLAVNYADNNLIISRLSANPEVPREQIVLEMFTLRYGRSYR